MSNVAQFSEFPSDILLKIQSDLFAFSEPIHQIPWSAAALQQPLFPRIPMNVDIPVSVWTSITALGSVGVMGPVTLMIAAWMALGYRWKYACAWLALLGTASALVALSKIAFIGWGIGVRNIDFTDFSGHSLMSTSVLPVAIFVALLPTRGAVRALGAAVALGFVCIAWRAESGKLAPTPVATSLAAVVVALHGVPVPTQHWITEIALRLSGHERPYVRASWKSKSYRAPDRRTELHSHEQPAA
ncbi:Membrane-associated phospholipid phosphatase [Candidatus Paraburkholderia schumanniana]|nr:Membrane-associated phospholipid phosphatase [Candidatus Paraburkholderia schumannianae]